jgi:hypothetical protein
VGREARGGRASAFQEQDRRRVPGANRRGGVAVQRRDLPALVEPIASGRADAAFGSRFMGGARPDGMKAQNLLANRILTAAANVLFGGSITDEATC